MKLERATRFLFVTFVVLITIAFVTACGGDEPAKPQAGKAAGEAPPPPLPPRSQREKLPAPSISETLAARVDLPDYYPSDAPVYDGSTTNSVGWDSGRVNAVFNTPDDPGQVSSSLQSTLGSNGWSEIVEAEMVNGVIVQAGKDDRSISVLVSRMEEGTENETTMILVTVDP